MGLQVGLTGRTSGCGREAPRPETLKMFGCPRKPARWGEPFHQDCHCHPSSLNLVQKILQCPFLGFAFQGAASRPPPSSLPLPLQHIPETAECSYQTHSGGWATALAGLLPFKWH